MKLPESNISVESSGVLKDQVFGIGNLGLVLDILRNRLYKDPIMAICREYSCNARDAHREVGTPERPIDICIPNSFNSHLEIRDYGPGISPDRMEQIFLNFGNSTKSGSNLETGAYGIGGKSGFAYSDTFTVITIIDGIKRTYNAYIDPTMVGKMPLMSQVVTDEPNGTLIRIPVLKADFTRFTTCILECTRHWNPRPNLLGLSPAPVYPEYKILFEGSDWKMFKTDSYRSSAKAVIDGIEYDIDINSIRSEGIRDIVENSFLLYFENGTLTIAASRDYIQYDDKTKAALREKFLKIKKDISNSIKAKIASCTSYKQACLTLRDISYQIRSFDSSGFVWNGKKVLTSFSCDVFGTYATVLTYKTVYFEKIKSRHVDLTAKIYHNDKGTQYLNKDAIKWLCTLNSGKSELIQIIVTPNKPNSKDFRGDDVKPTYNFDLIDLIEAEKLSAIKIPRNKASPKLKEEKKSNILKGYKLRYDNFSAIEFEDVGGVYVVIDYKDGNHTTEGHLITVRNAGELGKLLGKEVIGFTSARAEKLSPSWITLKQAVQIKIDEIGKSIPIKDLVEASKASKYTLKNSISYFDNCKSLMGKISDKDGLFFKYLEESDRVDKIVEKYEEYMRAARVVGIGFDSVEPKLAKVLSSVNKKYPMLNIIKSYYHLDKDDETTVIDYINMVDAKEVNNG